MPLYNRRPKLPISFTRLPVPVQIYMKFCLSVSFTETEVYYKHMAGIETTVKLKNGSLLVDFFNTHTTFMRYCRTRNRSSLLKTDDYARFSALHYLTMIEVGSR